MSEDGEDSEVAAPAPARTRAERAFERGDYGTTRRLLAGGDECSEGGDRDLARRMTPDRVVLVVALVAAVLLAALVSYYVIAR